jgi:Holliday junction resolvase RusA-like endonuclease
MNSYFNFRIQGVPYGHQKHRGNISALREWSNQIIEQTKNFPKVKEARILKVTFLLPPDKFPSDLPYGPDLDNLLKRLLDGLKQTIFSDAPGNDSCVISLTVMKAKVPSPEQAGVHIEVLPVSVKA